MTHTFPLSASAKVHHNTPEAELIELAIKRGEARFAATGALAVETGAHTGRSAQDKFTVRDATTEKAVWWDNNNAMSPEQFELLWADFKAHAASRELFVQDLFAGADPAHRLNARIFVEYAWHALFIRHLLRRPGKGELAGFAPQFTVVNSVSRTWDDRNGNFVPDCDLLAAAANGRIRFLSSSWRPGAMNPQSTKK